MYVQNILKLCQKLHIILLIKIRYEHKYLKLKLRVFLEGHTVAMLTYSVKNMITTCVPITQQFFDTMFVASIDNEW